MILKTGDVIYASCVDVLFCYHLGIVVDGLVYHNSPYNKNKYGGSVCVETYDEFMKGRELFKIVATHVTKEEIIKATRKCRRDVWDELFFNCEDYIIQVVEKRRDSDIRNAIKLAALGIIVLSFWE